MTYIAVDVMMLYHFGCQVIIDVTLVLNIMAESLMNSADTVEREAIKNAEENGIVFIDEIDKIIDVHR
jgi:ATP-dependent protease HslVU (ClpYQ) ATPase subunit